MINMIKTFFKIFKKIHKRPSSISQGSEKKLVVLNINQTGYENKIVNITRKIKPSSTGAILQPVTGPLPL